MSAPMTAGALFPMPAAWHAWGDACADREEHRDACDVCSETLLCPTGQMLKDAEWAAWQAWSADRRGGAS